MTGTSEVPKILNASPAYVTVAVFPTDDAEVYSRNNENNNYGGSNRVSVRNYASATTGNIRSFLKFDLSPFRYAKSISEAKLKLHCYTITNYIPGVNDVEIYGVDNDDWSESTITWYNQPPFDQALFQSNYILGWNLSPGENLWGYHGPPGDPDALYPYMDNYYENSITSFVLDQFTKHDYTISLMIKVWDEAYNDGTYHGFYCHSKDSQLSPPDAPYTQGGPDNWPQLVLTYEPPDFGMVGVTVSPVSQSGLQGVVRSFIVDITNLGGIDNENYVLSASDNQGWSMAFSGNFVTDNRLENVRLGEKRTVTLNVTIPYPTPIGTQDNILITAIDPDNTRITDNKNCYLTVTDQILVTDTTMVSDVYPDKNIENNYIRVESSRGSYWSWTDRTFHADNGNVRIFLKFPIDNSYIASGLTVTSARINLYCWSANYDDMDAQVYGVDNNNWEGALMTWNTQPAMDNVPLDTITLTSWPPETKGVENKWVPNSLVPSSSAGWEVGSFVQGRRLVGENFASFCIKAAVENTSGMYFFNNEAAKEGPILYPKLVITFGSPQRAVSLSISPVHRIGDNGVTENFTVTVMNKGTNVDSFTLTSIADNTSWSITFDNENCYNVLPGKSVARTLRVTIPANAVPGAVNNIKVTATGTGSSPPSDSENCSVSVKKTNSWVVAGYAPCIDNYGVAVTSARGYIYVANSNTLGTRASFMRYNPTAGGSWEYLATPGISFPFKNGTVLAWDKGNYIYALMGGAYSDNKDNSSARHWFFRYNIENNKWENLKPTGNTDNENSNVGAQGAGDAMTIDTTNHYVYALVGNRYIGSTFWRYNISNNTWEELNLSTSGWWNTDDGCSLVWTGGNYIYAFQGENQGAYPINNKFSRYSISGNSWTSLAPVTGGVGDGASLIWLGGDNIYATTGGDPVSEIVRDNVFFVYSISGNSWTKLENLPKGIGIQNGPRLGFIGSSIYCWRGAQSDPVLWVYTLPVLVEQFSLRLLTGWNLIGFQVTNADMTPNNLFSGITYTMYYWVAPNGPYSEPNKNLPVEDNRGYWVKVSQDTAVTFSGIRQLSRTMYFLTGWNLVSFPNTSANTTPNNLFSGITYTMYYWVAPNGPYSEPNKNLPVEDNRGYWVKVNQNWSVQIPI
jgi:hypothetical protein